MPQLRYHHVGIPTDQPLPKEDYIADVKACPSGYMQSPYGIEWMKFDRPETEVWPKGAKFK